MTLKMTSDPFKRLRGRLGAEWKGLQIDPLRSSGISAQITGICVVRLTEFFWREIYGLIT